jgi:hypothetical protein
MKTDTLTLAAAMDALALEIQSADGVANAAIAEAADRLRALEVEVGALTIKLGGKAQRRKSILKGWQQTRANCS